MKCQRCWRIEAATYRVRSDLIDVKVCGACAEEARSLGIVVEALARIAPCDGDRGRALQNEG